HRGTASAAFRKQLTEISKVNDETRMLSFNAAIEAARAGGSSGKAFGIVANAIRELSDRTAGVSDAMNAQTGKVTVELRSTLDALAKDVRGTRLMDLALTNIDLIDRNLYERSCDVRWWATDPSLVDALTNPQPQTLAFASKRMGVILSAYTVYHDLVLADTHGQIIANGKPNLFASQGMNIKDQPWFRDAMSTRTGGDFAFQTCHASPMVNGQRILAYSCAVRERGEAHGRVIGVLGILFNWDSLAQTIVKNTPLTEDEKKRTRCCIVDDAGLILADAAPQLGLAAEPGYRDRGVGRCACRRPERPGVCDPVEARRERGGRSRPAARP
ncbi:MAG: hypothetical protein HC794_03785, partial [Nitrospiraceae bacterium]|nr:hypothetical protein [Nitrospiraceae bacterium]